MYIKRELDVFLYFSSVLLCVLELFHVWRKSKLFFFRSQRF